MFTEIHGVLTMHSTSNSSSKEDESAEPPSCIPPTTVSTPRQSSPVIANDNVTENLIQPFAAHHPAPRSERQPSVYLLAGLARISLLQGQFERTQTLVKNL